MTKYIAVVRGNTGSLSFLRIEASTLVKAEEIAREWSQRGPGSVSGSSVLTVLGLNTRICLREKILTVSYEHVTNNEW